MERAGLRASDEKADPRRHTPFPGAEVATERVRQTVRCSSIILGLFFALLRLCRHVSAFW